MFASLKTEGVQMLMITSQIWLWHTRAQDVALFKNRCKLLCQLRIWMLLSRKWERCTKELNKLTAKCLTIKWCSIREITMSCYKIRIIWQPENNLKHISPLLVNNRLVIIQTFHFNIIKVVLLMFLWLWKCKRIILLKGKEILKNYLLRETSFNL